MSGHGTVLGVCVFHRAYLPGLDLPLPYTVIHVRLDEGPQLYSNPIDPQLIYEVGQKVDAVFVPAGEEQALVRFKAAGSKA